jgi:DNA-binding YbaB/EbfC family protein
MNFSDLSKMKEMLSQASEMREQMERQLAETIVEATSGGGVVTARINGKKELLKLTIDPVVMTSSPGDIEMLEDLIAAAVNQAGREVEEKLKSAMSGMLGGLNLPGLP